jgi:hypothetical protein
MHDSTIFVQKRWAGWKRWKRDITRMWFYSSIIMFSWRYAAVPSEKSLYPWLIGNLCMQWAPATFVWGSFCGNAFEFVCPGRRYGFMVNDLGMTAARFKYVPSKLASSMPLWISALKSKLVLHAGEMPTVDKEEIFWTYMVVLSIYRFQSGTLLPESSFLHAFVQSSCKPRWSLAFSHPWSIRTVALQQRLQAHPIYQGEGAEIAKGKMIKDKRHMFLIPTRIRFVRPNHLVPLPAHPSAFHSEIHGTFISLRDHGLSSSIVVTVFLGSMTMTERRRLFRQGTIPAAPCNSHPLPGTVLAGYLVACSTANLYIHMYRHV